MRRKFCPMACAAVALLAVCGSAQAASRIEKNLKLESGGRFILSSSGGDVTLSGSAESGAHVTIESNRSDLENLFEFQFLEEPGAVRVVANRRGPAYEVKNLHLHFEVEVPKQTNLELRTGGGDVKVRGIMGDTNLHTSGGDLELTDLKGKLEAETSGGDIKLRQLTGDMRVKTSGGDIRIEGASGRVDAHTSGGDVEARFAPGNGRGGEIETSGGEIRVALDPAINLDLDASTSGGEVKSDLPVKMVGNISSRKVHATLGSGGEVLRLHTSGGDINIHSL
jgi:hypothetical protein